MSLTPSLKAIDDHDRWTTSAIIVATYGEDTNGHWDALAQRAMESSFGQGAKTLRINGKTLASARNEAALYANADWLIFLDADDELAPNYVRAMFQAGSGDIRKPSTLGIVGGVEDDYPVMIPAKDINVSNHIVIGAMVNRKMFLEVGGFRELPALEDWDLWLRMIHQCGAKVTEVPNAIYKVHVNRDGRNQNHRAHHDAYLDIKNYMRRNYGR